MESVWGVKSVWNGISSYESVILVWSLIDGRGRMDRQSNVYTTPPTTYIPDFNDHHFLGRVVQFPVCATIGKRDGVK